MVRGAPGGRALPKALTLSGDEPLSGSMRFLRPRRFLAAGHALEESDEESRVAADEVVGDA